MSEISKLIFNGASHYITSPYGSRGVISTSAGNTASFHYGTDYGTNNKKLAQYAIEDGYCFASAKASDGANYVWIIYPRIKKAMLHYHLDSRKIFAGESVKKGTLLGYTGKSGKATGIHLHLGIRDISKLTTAQINNMTWSKLQSCSYVNPEAVPYEAPKEVVVSNKVYSNGATSFNKAYRNGRQYTVNAIVGLRMRKSPKTGTVIKVLKNKSKLMWYGYYSKDSSGKNWFYVTDGTNEGFVSGDYIK